MAVVRPTPADERWHHDLDVLEAMDLHLVTEAWMRGALLTGG
jgi:hypothetical protein